MKISKYFRNNIAVFKPYSPSPKKKELDRMLEMSEDQVVKLNSGENISITDDLPNLGDFQINVSRYPDASARNIKKQLSLYSGFATDMITCGNGSDELIDLLFRVFINKGEEVVICPPTFSMYSFFGNLAEAKIISVNRNSNLGIDCSLLLKKLTKKTKMIIIDSPGNPAGSVISKKDVQRLCDTDVIIVIDEAYIEFGGETVAELLDSYPNLIILRTLSKWAGLAGLRLGYMLADPQIITSIESIMSPYNVNVVAQEVGAAVLQNSKKILRKVSEISLRRDRLIQQIGELDSISIYPSKSNYILFKPKNNKTDELYKYLFSKGIIIKKLSQPVIGSCLRACVGSKQEMEMFLDQLTAWNRKQFDGILFDMDGVLVDVSSSYRKAIQLTVNRLLGKKNVSQDDIEKIKKISGFNNDWDVSYALKYLYRKKVDTNNWTVIAKKLLPIDRSQVEYQEIYDIFQTYYLGSELYSKILEKNAAFKYTNGCMNSETCLVDVALLRKLKDKKILMGIATGRPKREAFEAIKMFELTEFFSEKNVVALEDTENEKPDPEPLILVKEKVSCKSPVYIGDTKNDMEAAKSAKMQFYKIDSLKNDSFDNVNECIRFLLYD